MFYISIEHAITCYYNYVFYIEHLPRINEKFNYKTVVELNYLTTVFYSLAEHLFMQQHHGGVMSKL